LISFDGSCVKKTFQQRYSSGNYWGIIVLAAGLFLGFALGEILAKVLHISKVGAGYFAAFPAETITRFAIEWFTMIGKQVERVVLNALETAALPAWNFLCYQCVGRLAFGDSIVLRTRRSTLAPVYV
jgi:hypothetical protein